MKQNNTTLLSIEPIYSYMMGKPSETLKRVNEFILFAIYSNRKFAPNILLPYAINLSITSRHPRIAIDDAQCCQVLEVKVICVFRAGGMQFQRLD